MDYRPRPQTAREPADGDLSGTWRATPLTWQLRRTGVDDDLEDADWHRVAVPGHWGQVNGLENEDGPVLHRLRFSHRAPVDDERLWLRFDGVLGAAEVWLDGNYVGETGAYFASHRFDITGLASRSDEHLLAVEVACPAEGSSRAKTSMTGSLQTGHLAPTGNPGGIWRDVRIDSTGPVAIRHARLLCTAITVDRGRDAESASVAELTVRLVVDAAAKTEVRIDTSVLGPDGAAAGGDGQRHELASGENRIEWTIPIEGPQLWWPAALGEQPRYDVAVAVRLPDGELSDRQDWRTGLRRVQVDNFIWRINGRRLFAKGVGIGPSDRFLADVEGETVRQDLAAASEAGFDLVRVYGHVARDELYDEADRLGMLIWQDLPLVGGYSSKVRSGARALARATVDHLGHHPSVSLWCGRCEYGEQDPADLQRTPGILLRRVGRTMVPGWNRSVLDPVLRREILNADRTRPVVTRSGSLPTPADQTGSDANLWLGWRTGTATDLPKLLRRWPKLGAFLSNIGTQSASTSHPVDDVADWPGAEQASLTRYLPRSAYPDNRAWAAATQAYQADVLRVHIETLRRLKYRPVGGFAIAALVDAEDAGGFGIFDKVRRPKQANAVVVDACRPVIVVAENPPSVVVPGQRLELPVHVVNDLAETLGPMRLTATVHNPTADDDRSSDRSMDGPIARAQWEGEVAADTCERVGVLRFEVPDRPQRLQIDLELEWPASTVTNRYTTVVIPSSEAMD